MYCDKIIIHNFFMEELMLKIFTDTSANLPKNLIEKYNLTVIPFTYSVDGEDYDYDMDGDFNGKAFYDAMRNGAYVKTSMINIVSYIHPFEKALKDGFDVLYIGMSGGISGAANAAQVAVKELKETYPNAKIAAIDTFAASMGEGLFVIKAAEMINKGASFEEVVETIMTKRHKMCQFFTVDDLEYLKRGGRVSGTVAFIGSLLNIKPILRGDEIGRIIVCGKVRGMKQALLTLADKYDKLALDKSADISVAHADNEKDADALTELLRKKGFTGECIKVLYEPVTGSHVGPGTIALFFHGKEKS